MPSCIVLGQFLTAAGDTFYLQLSFPDSFVSSPCSSLSFSLFSFHNFAGFSFSLTPALMLEWSLSLIDVVLMWLELV